MHYGRLLTYFDLIQNFLHSEGSNKSQTRKINMSPVFYAVGTSEWLDGFPYLIEIFGGKADFVRPVYGKRV